ncbi:MAG TPA: phosphoribosylanthranilate isomerase [Dehalococcoidia bacterium]|nr:phosphoribosylanthranilate isomerase [Dehalococcoidia bacterium]
MVKVKICGCRSVDEALAAAEAGADFIGLNFAASPRRVSVEDAGEIVRALGRPLREMEQAQPPALYRVEKPDLRSWFEHGASALERMLERKRPLTVGVFAAMEADEVNDIADEVEIDLIQLSGSEPWSRCLLANRQVIKVLHVAPSDTAKDVIARVEAGSALAVMLDRGRAGAYGGTGERVDVAVAAEVARVMPIWLAGGLTPENVASTVRAVSPWCVDVASGVETDGTKDHEKIRRFIREAKS